MREIIVFVTVFHLTMWMLGVWRFERLFRGVREHLVSKTSGLKQYLLNCVFCLAPYFTVANVCLVWFIPERFINILTIFAVTVFWAPHVLVVVKNFVDGDDDGFSDFSVVVSPDSIVDKPVDKGVDNL